MDRRDPAPKQIRKPELTLSDSPLVVCTDGLYRESAGQSPIRRPNHPPVAKTVSKPASPSLIGESPSGHKEKKVIEGAKQEARCGARAARTPEEVLTRKVIEAQEAERRRIAQDIHDESEQLLGHAIFRLEMCLMQKSEGAPGPKTDPEDAKSLSEAPGDRCPIDRIRDMLVETVHSLQSISHRLRPAVLDDLGLEAGLAWFFRTSGLEERLKLQWKVTGLNGRLPENVETAVFRIVEEACNNALKYARAGNLYVDVRVDHGRVVTVINDDGVGFDAKTFWSRNVREDSIPMGISGMKERARLLGGKFTIHSEPGKGTWIAVVIPLRS